MKKIFRIFHVLERNFLKLFAFINVDFYMRKYTQYLRKQGLDIQGMPKFIDRSVYFDGNDYSKIHIGDNITISREVMLLTHDYSITTGMAAIGKKINRYEGELYFLQDITIGENCFIGARSSILPGATIGNNCIIGACAVVKGRIPANSIVVGNPGKVIGNTISWVEKKAEEHLYSVEK